MPNLVLTSLYFSLNKLNDEGHNIEIANFTQAAPPPRPPLLVSYQREVDKGKLTAVRSFEKLTFRACALRRSKVEDYGLCLLIYWGMKLCCWIHSTNLFMHPPLLWHSNGGCINKLVE